MKKVTILLFVIGTSSAFGQAISSPVNSMKYMDITKDGEPIGHKTILNTADNSKNSAILIRLPNNDFSEITIEDVKAVLDARINLFNERSEPVDPDQNSDKVDLNKVATEQELSE